MSKKTFHGEWSVPFSKQRSFNNLPTLLFVATRAIGTFLGSQRHQFKWLCVGLVRNLAVRSILRNLEKEIMQ